MHITLDKNSGKVEATPRYDKKLTGRSLGVERFSVQSV